MSYSYDDGGMFKSTPALGGKQKGRKASPRQNSRLKVTKLNTVGNNNMDTRTKATALAKKAGTTVPDQSPGNDLPIMARTNTAPGFKTGGTVGLKGGRDAYGDQPSKKTSSASMHGGKGPVNPGAGSSGPGPSSTLPAKGAGKVGGTYKVGTNPDNQGKNTPQLKTTTGSDYTPNRSAKGPYAESMPHASGKDEPTAELPDKFADWKRPDFWRDGGGSTSKGPQGKGGQGPINRSGDGKAKYGKGSSTPRKPPYGYKTGGMVPFQRANAKGIKDGAPSPGSENGRYEGAVNRDSPSGYKDGGTKNFIKGAIKKPGALHESLGVPQGEKIPAGKIASAASKGGKLGQRARFAQTLAGLRKKK